MGSLGEIQGIAPGLAKEVDNPLALARIARLLADAGAVLQEDTQSAYCHLKQAMELLCQVNDSDRGKRRLAGGLTRWQMRRLDDYIGRHLDIQIRTSALAGQIGLSVSHFAHVFKETFGITPLAYVTRRRIESALDMMIRTNDPLTRIAHIHGFCDQSHFSRTFRREIGISPQAWRQRRGCL